MRSWTRLLLDWMSTRRSVTDVSSSKTCSVTSSWPISMRWSSGNLVRHESRRIDLMLSRSKPSSIVNLAVRARVVDVRPSISPTVVRNVQFSGAATGSSASSGRVNVPTGRVLMSIKSYEKTTSPSSTTSDTGTSTEGPSVVSFAAKAKVRIYNRRLRTEGVDRRTLGAQNSPAERGENADDEADDHEHGGGWSPHKRPALAYRPTPGRRPQAADLHLCQPGAPEDVAKRGVLAGSFLGATLVTALLAIVPLYESSIAAIDLLFTFRQAPTVSVDLLASRSTTDYRTVEAIAASNRVDEQQSEIALWYPTVSERILSREFRFIPPDTPDWVRAAEQWRADIVTWRATIAGIIGEPDPSLLGDPQVLAVMVDDDPEALGPEAAAALAAVEEVPLFPTPPYPATPQEPTESRFISAPGHRGCH